MALHTENMPEPLFTGESESYFGLSGEILNPVKFAASQEPWQEGNYLQQLHYQNHHLADKEIVHDLFSGIDDHFEIDEQLLSVEDEKLFASIQDAVTERGILDLRANLQSIAQGIAVHERTQEEIEDYLSGDLDEEIEKMVREEMAVNASLSAEIALHKDINQATEEFDIMKLRGELRGIMNREYSHSQSIGQIDSYLNDDPEMQGLEEFEQEMMLNSGLAADVAFHKEVDSALGEKDVMSLRATLQRIGAETNQEKTELLGVKAPKRRTLYWYAIASSIALMIGLGSLLSQSGYSDNQLYTRYYTPYKSATDVSRSAITAGVGLGRVVQEMNKGNYAGALRMLDGVAASERNKPGVRFYSGIAYQELGQYRKAIESFSIVVNQGDNLMVEQSEWYIGLCYLKTEEREKAIGQFRQIAARKGYYSKQSDKLLRQLE